MRDHPASGSLLKKKFVEQIDPCATALSPRLRGDEHVVVDPGAAATDVVALAMGSTGECWRKHAVHPRANCTHVRFRKLGC